MLRPPKPFVDIDLMPGHFDPTNHMMPQQPLHRCLFSAANAFCTLHQVPNPYEAEIDGLRILGTSGQPVNDIYRFCGIKSHSGILEKLMHWQHVCPSAPDTLSSYPFYDSDPFVVENAPHIFFAGNQPRFHVDKIKSPSSDHSDILLLSIPRFRQSSTAVLVNVRDLTAVPVRFGTFAAPLLLPTPESDEENNGTDEGLKNGH